LNEALGVDVQFRIDDGASSEEIFRYARGFFAKLVREQGELKSCIRDLKAFHDQLALVKLEDPRFLRKMNILRQRCCEHVMYLQLLDECYHIKNELRFLEKLTLEKRINVLENSMEKFLFLFTKCDLENKNNSWYIIGRNNFLLSHTILMDQVASCARILAETALERGDLQKAEGVRERMLKTYREQKDNMNLAFLVALRKHLSIKNALKKTEPVLISQTHSAPRKERDQATDGTPNPHQEIPFAPRKERDQATDGTRNPHQEIPSRSHQEKKKSDYELLCENLETNIQFFRLGSD
jgi:hypothetical protein